MFKDRVTQEGGPKRDGQGEREIVCILVAVQATVLL